TALGSWQYKPNYAQGYTDRRHKEKHKHIKFTKQVEQFVREKLGLDWSPEQISGYAKRHKLFSISHEWIYQFILNDKEKGGVLHKHLRHQNKNIASDMVVPKNRVQLRIAALLMNARPSLIINHALGIGK
ncbi:MAG TPA: hypothetical protein VHM20_07590, partial [Gammaproteobacteria bacterium]|nr:hypothetical protein [Gammaproteobacteria bacterium]